MQRPGESSGGQIVGRLVAFTLVGVPLVSHRRGALNDTLAGHVVRSRLLLAVPALVVFVTVLVLTSRRVRAWDGRQSR